ncbi:MAG: hypothetical protein ACTSYA_08525 [Candidatus Kariarchaeaceae archaeon]
MKDVIKTVLVLIIIVLSVMIVKELVEKNDVPDTPDDVVVPAGGCQNDLECAEQPELTGVCTEGKCSYIEPAVVKLTVLSDKTCSGCDTTQVVGVTEQLFKGVEIEYVDVSDEAGKELVEKYDVKLAPTYLFDSGLENTQTWKTNAQIKGAFEPTEDGFKLIDEATGSSYIIDEEERQAFYGEIGVDLTDGKPQLDFFVMSYCPYGNIADEMASEVYEVLGNKAIFVPRYVIYSNYQGGGPQYCIDEASEICSMHGIQELNQNIREKCVYEDEGTEEWFDFALAMNDACTYQNADTCWTAVAEDLGLDTDAISTCEETRGEELMRADLELQGKLGVTGSPTLFIEGDKYGGQRSGKDLLAGMCAYFDEAPEECGTVLEATALAPAGSC